MPAMVSGQLSLIQKRIWHSFLVTNSIFALINGIYSSYTFLYIKNRLESAGSVSANILDSLLFILVVSMFLEFIAEPITGDWADTYGRRRVIVGSFVGLVGAFLCYWLISGIAMWRLSAGLEPRYTIAMALAAELLFAISAALFNGALEAWFVDELHMVGGPAGVALLPFFVVQRRWFAICMLIGGVLPLWFTSAALGRHVRADGGLFSVVALPWVAAACVTALGALWASRRLVEKRLPSLGDGPTHRRIFVRLKRALGARDLRNGLLISSLLYTCWVSFMYLLPVLLTEKSIVSEAGFFQSILKNYYWYYLAISSSRFIGPFLSNRLCMGRNQTMQFRLWGVLNCGALSLAGLVLLARSAPGLGLPDSVKNLLVPAALLLFWVTKVAEEAFKPVRSTYLNNLIVEGKDRAFILSMATPFGAVIILVGAVLLAAAQKVVLLLNDVQFSISLLFLILGSLSVILTVRLSHQSQK